MLRGSWVDPAAGKEPLAGYAARWLLERPTALQPRTLEFYESVLRVHILPTFGETAVSAITPPAVRAWHAELRRRTGAPTVAKAYRLLRSILTTAVEDELLLRNPCILRGAGTERSPERKPPTLSELDALARAVDRRFRLLVLLAGWSGLRWGELTALSRRRIDLAAGTVEVTRSHVECNDGKPQPGPPKSAAGRRVVYLPPHLIPDVAEHLAEFVGSGPDALLFTGPLGATLNRRNFHNVWKKARTAAGCPEVRFHDLRHLAATLAATTGATTKELMARMGHASPRAALLYQHATRDRDAAIAVALSELARSALSS